MQTARKPQVASVWLGSQTERFRRFQFSVGMVPLEVRFFSVSAQFQLVFGRTSALLVLCPMALILTTCCDLQEVAAVLCLCGFDECAGVVFVLFVRFCAIAWCLDSVFCCHLLPRVVKEVITT